jgi:hypothetical protein
MMSSPKDTETPATVFGVPFKHEVHDSRKYDTPFDERMARLQLKVVLAYSEPKCDAGAEFLSRTGKEETEETEKAEEGEIHGHSSKEKAQTRRPAPNEYGYVVVEYLELATTAKAS